MTPEDFKMCEYIYANAICPVCGAKATYRPTAGLHTYKEIKCGHNELEEIIEQRVQEYLDMVRRQ